MSKLEIGAVNGSEKPLSSSKRSRMALFVTIVFTLPAVLCNVSAQTVFISDAWWTFQQDCNGDGCKAGTLPGEMARLNWEPDVTNCTGTVLVFEKVYVRSCGSLAWTTMYTNPPHAITACRSLNQQYVDLPFGADCVCRDYKIEIYRNGRTVPDHTRSNTNDADLAQHKEQMLAQDFCLSDMFASCISLRGPAGSESDNNQNATKEPSEPNHAGNAGGRSLWYCWSTTNNTIVTFDTLGTTFDTLLAVYTGNDVSNLTLIAGNDDVAGATNRLSKVSFTPVPGMTYHIAVDGYGGASGIVNLNWNQSAQALPDLIIWGPSASPIILSRTFAANDCEVLEGCGQAGTRRLLSFTTETRNIGAGDLVIGNPAANPLFIWATCHQHWHFEQFAEFSLLDTNGNVVAAGHKVGFCIEDVQPWSANGRPARYNCNNQGLQAGWADIYPGFTGFSSGVACQYIDITTVAPSEYVLQMVINPDNKLIESRTDNNITYVPVTIPPANCTIVPASDSFANATVVNQVPFSGSELNNCATREAGEPNHAGQTGGHSLWFFWTSESNHTAVITTKRSDFDTLLAVYTGTSVSSLTRVASNDDIALGYLLQSSVRFPATAGTTYLIAIDGYNSAVGNAVLNINPPPNDDFLTAFVISGTSGATNGYCIGASKELFEPAHASDVGGHSVWYNWTAPSSGPVDFNTLGSDFDTTLAVYNGGVVTNLTPVVSNDDDVETGGLSTSHLWFFANAGTTYRIAVDGFVGDFGNIVLNWNMDSKLAIMNLADGTVQVGLTGVDWHRYTLLGSTNSLLWSTNAPTITMSSGLHLFTKKAASNGAPLQLFRAIRAP